jgi:hypothetical protein
LLEKRCLVKSAAVVVRNIAAVVKSAATAVSVIAKIFRRYRKIESPESPYRNPSASFVTASWASGLKSNPDIFGWVI